MAMSTSTESNLTSQISRNGDTRSLVRASGLSRHFGDFLALDGVSLEIDREEIFGLIGPSGSGKTTLVKLILGLLTASEGVVTVDGVPSDELAVSDKRRLGYMPQEFSLYPSLNVLENARFMAGIYGVGWLRRRRRIREVLSFLEIWDVRRRLAQDLSGGMRRRLALAGALLHEPELLILDEPTAGLDPDLRQRIWDQLREIRAGGTTILMTTQYLEEAERCDSVAILSHGRLAATGTPAELRLEAGLPDIIEVEASGLTSAIVESLWRVDCVRGVEWNRGSLLLVRVDDQASTQGKISSVLDHGGCVVGRMQGRSATFEEIFTSFTRVDGA